MLQLRHQLMLRAYPRGEAGEYSGAVPQPWPGCVNSSGSRNARRM